ncbi:MAG: phosphoribosylanthranilate isomerase [Terriglobales bacterium]
MTWVKICGTTNLQDARLAVEAGADAVGFVFAESPRRVEPAQVAEITAQLPESVEKVGVFVNERMARIREIVKQAGLTAVQLHGDETVEYASLLFPDDEDRAKLYRALSMKTLFSAANVTAFLRGHRVKPVFDAVLVDSGSPTRGGSGLTFDWERARPFVEGLKKSGKVIVAGGLTSENVAKAIEMFRPWGVDVASGVEQGPGRKDPAKVRAFVAAAKGIR